MFGGALGLPNSLEFVLKTKTSGWEPALRARSALPKPYDTPNRGGLRDVSFAAESHSCCTWVVDRAFGLFDGSRLPAGDDEQPVATNSMNEAVEARLGDEAHGLVLCLWALGLPHVGRVNSKSRPVTSGTCAPGGLSLCYPEVSECILASGLAAGGHRALFIGAVLALALVQGPAWAQEPPSAQPPLPLPPSPSRPASAPPILSPSSVQDGGTATGVVPSRVAFQLAFRTGYMAPFGNIDGAPGDSMGNFFSGEVPLTVDIGWKVVPNVLIGAYLGFGIGGASGSEAATNTLFCGSASYRVGLEGQYQFLPDGALNPWLGYGLGFEWIGLDCAYSSASAGGIEFAHFMAGLNVRLSRTIAVGPIVDFSLGEYSTFETTGATPTSGIAGKALHEWLSIGGRVVFFP